MAKTDIIISGTDASVTFNSAAIVDINTITLGLDSDRDEINLSTLSNTSYETGLLGDLLSVDDIVINKKSAPAVDMALTLDNKQLVISYDIGESTGKTATFWAQLKNITPSSVERSPGDGVNVDLVFAVTNLNASLAETAPVIAAQA